MTRVTGSAWSSMPARATRISPGSRRARRAVRRGSARAPDLAMIAVQGPNARDKTARAAAAAPDGAAPLSLAAVLGAPKSARWFIARTGYTGEDGFEIMRAGGRGRARSGRRCTRRASRPAGLGARDTLRLEAGMNLYGNDMDESTSPARVGTGLDRRIRARGRAIHRPRGARGRARGAAAASWSGCCSRSAGVLRGHQRVRRPPARRRRGHQRHLLADARPLDRAGPACRADAGRAGARWRSAASCSPARVVQAAFRAQRQALMTCRAIRGAFSDEQRTGRIAVHQEPRVGAAAAGRQVEVGITDHAQERARRPGVRRGAGRRARACRPGEACAVVESVKAASDVYSPIAGRSLAGNAALGADAGADQPGSVRRRLADAHRGRRPAAAVAAC